MQHEILIEFYSVTQNRDWNGCFRKHVMEIWGFKGISWLTWNEIGIWNEFSFTIFPREVLTNKHFRKFSIFEGIWILLLLASIINSLYF